MELAAISQDLQQRQVSICVWEQLEPSQTKAGTDKRGKQMDREESYASDHRLGRLQEETEGRDKGLHLIERQHQKMQIQRQ